MKLVEKSITLSELNEMTKKMDGNLVKAVVDVEKGVMVVDAPMHVDEELYFFEELESQQEHLWGINLFPAKYPNDDWIVFDSMINLRPSWGNRSSSVENPLMQAKIRKIVSGLVAL